MPRGQAAKGNTAGPASGGQKVRQPFHDQKDSRILSMVFRCMHGIDLAVRCRSLAQDSAFYVVSGNLCVVGDF